jgi:hypothetical protein|tara:strand:- start:739 stop:933 length:195 start_codon:yes stop_codon:yes gene_type:complete
MSKTMQWAWDKAETKLEDTVDKLRCGFITQSQAVKEIQDADENWALMGFDTVDDVIDYMTDEVK